MALAFNVSGPTAVEITVPGGSTYSILGYTDNDSMIEVTTAIGSRRVTSTKTGDAPGAIVYRGMWAVIAMELVEWDTDVRNARLRVPGQNSAGGSGTVGLVWDSDSYIGLRLTPQIAGKTQFTFGRCFYDGEDAIREFDFGNTERRLAVVMTALVDGSGNLYTESTTS